MKRPSITIKALELGALLLPFVLPVDAEAVTINIESNASWTVSDVSGNDLGNAQNVCLNATVPSNCPAGATSYGYPFLGWTAGLSSIPGAKWIWANKKSDGTPITGATTGAANAEYSFKTNFYICGDHPQDGTIWVAGDNSVEVFLNGAPVLSWNSHSAVGSASIPATSLVTGLNPNVIELKVKNGSNPSDCGTDQYQCNPAGVVFGGKFGDELSANPTCSNPFGKVGDPPRYLGSCAAPKTGSRNSICVCFMGGATWFNYENCMPPPVQCAGFLGGHYNPDELEKLGDCSSGQSGAINHKCKKDGNWEPISNTCTPLPPPSKMCMRFSDGAQAPVGAIETLTCPYPTTMGSASHTCQADGTWTATDFMGCTLPPGSVGDVCGSKDAVTKACPAGTSCGPRVGPAPPRPGWCWTFDIFGVLGPGVGSLATPSACRPVATQTTDWFCDP